MDWPKWAAWIWLALAAYGILASPFEIGKPRKPYAASTYAVTLAFFLAVTLPVIGRAMGWW